MDQKLDEQLCKDFPLLFKDRRGDMSTTCMYWGFPGDGWEPIIREAASKLEPLIAQYIKDNPTDEYLPCASQVKEKFGTLRLYLSTGTEEMYDIAAEAEDKSRDTCEECGKPGQLRRGGWLKTLCNEHANGKPVYEENYN